MLGTNCFVEFFTNGVFMEYVSFRTSHILSSSNMQHKRKTMKYLEFLLAVFPCSFSLRRGVGVAGKGFIIHL